MKNSQLKRNFQQQFIAILMLCLVSLPAWASTTFNEQHVLQGLHYLAIIIQDFCIVGGLAFIIGGLFKMKRYGQMRTMMSHQITLMQPLSKIIIGTCLLMIPVATNTLLLAFWGNSNPLAYPDMSGVSASFMKPVIMSVRLVGLVGLIRGIMLFSRVGGPQGQPGMAGKAFLHIIGGILCLHIINTYYIIKYMLGIV